jgi:hypothetical protein
MGNVWQYEKLGILKLQSFNLPHCLFVVNPFIFTTFRPIFYIACCAVVLFYPKRIGNSLPEIPSNLIATVPIL